MARGLQKARNPLSLSHPILPPLTPHLTLQIEAQQKAQANSKKGGNSILKKDKGMKYQCVCSLPSSSSSSLLLLIPIRPVTEITFVEKRGRQGERGMMLIREEILQSECKTDIDNKNNMKIHWEVGIFGLPSCVSPFLKNGNEGEMR